MIRINLATRADGPAIGSKDRVRKLRAALGPLAGLAVLAGAGAAGWSWRSALAEESSILAARIVAAERRLEVLEAANGADARVEFRLETLRSRVDAIDALFRGPANPAVLLDQVSRAMDRIDSVWLERLTHSGERVSLEGRVTSQTAFADFIAALRGTGHFRKVEFGNLEQDGDYLAFDLTCEFAPARSGAGPVEE